MNLNNRISNLERTLRTLPCSCPNSADLAWPGHQPHPHCHSCGGQRLIYPLTQHPARNESLLRTALPILSKAYNGNPTADLTKLTNNELQQLKTALKATQH